MMAFGQILLYNDGAMLKIQPGATLFVEGGIQNTASGTIDNDGMIELQGNFVNAGTWEPSQPNTLKFSGPASSNVTSGSAVFQTVVIQKGAAADVNLLSHMTIQTLLDFNGNNNKLSLGNFDLNLEGGTMVTGYDSDEFVMTGGSGKLKKAYTATGPFEFPVGFTTSTYNPAEINVTAGPNDTYGVRVLGSPTSDGNGFNGATPITTEAVDAVWDISENTVGGNTANIELGWAETDELPDFDDSMNSVARNDGTGWDGLFEDLGPEIDNTQAKSGFTAFGAFAVGGRTVANELAINPKVFLQGPYNATTDLMSDALRTNNYIPTVEPYSAAPFNYTHVGYGGGESVTSSAIFDQPADANDIVDWIVIEIRDATTPATKLATRTALIQRDGDIVGLDGASGLKINGLADGTYHIGLKHRNHLPIRTQTAQVMGSTPIVLNFTVDDVAFDNGSTNNEPTATVEPGVEAMWGGDVDNSNIVAYGTGDRLAILNLVGTTTPSALVNGYYREDATMDGIVAYGTGDRLFVLNIVGTTTPSRLVTAHQ
jgi:hypothetical protein